MTNSGESMKLRANRTELADALAWVAKAIRPRPQTPIFGAVRLTVAERLTIEAFDYETAHTTEVSVESVQPGNAAVSGLMLSQLIGSLRSDEVELVQDDGRLRITAGRSTYDASTLNVADFPALPAQPEAVGVISADDMVEALKQVTHAADDAHSNEALRGLGISAEGKQLTFVGLDGFRLSVVDLPWAGTDFSAHMLAKPLVASIAGMTGTLALGCVEGRFSVVSSSRSATFSQLGEHLANWAPLLRDQHSLTIEVDVAELIEVAKRLALVAEQNVPLVLTATADELSISIAGDTSGTEQIQCIASDEISVCLKPEFLLSTLTALRTERVTLGLISAVKPICFVPTDGRASHVVMPLRSPGA